ncbi:aldehyde dehydrogenase family protein [Pimelobacter simplex]|uniref:aldehyde dehydrogenase family protein n=1 Tax=Nocardioides simplex TaxID=2045 RepID=UPI001EE410DF
MAAKMRNMGEACTAANRFLVHESVAGEFARLLAGKMSDLTPARGTEAESTLGPLIHAGARDQIHRLVTAAVAEGATVATGGGNVESPGYFYQPTVLVDVPNTAEILSQEIFGPVAPVTTFRTESEAITMANASEYGLAAYLFSRDHNRLIRVADQIDFGMVGFNSGMLSNAAAPFGGVKQSGLGREGGAEGLGEYTSAQYICIADPFAAPGSATPSASADSSPDGYTTVS